MSEAREYDFGVMVEWDAAYDGTVMRLTRESLVRHLTYDADQLVDANHHGEAESLRLVRDAVEALGPDEPLGWFAWHVSDLGPIRRCVVVGP